MSRFTTRRFPATGVIILALILVNVAIATPRFTEVSAQGGPDQDVPHNLVNNLNTSTPEQRTYHLHTIGNEPSDYYDHDTTVRVSHREAAVEFTTGGADHGYYVKSVTIHMWRAPSATESNPVIEIWDTRDHRPRQLVGTLITPDPMDIGFHHESNDLFTFATLGNGIHVDPNTTYHLKASDAVADDTTLSYFIWGVTVDDTENDVEDSFTNTESGWTIADAMLYRIAWDRYWLSDGNSHTFRFGIKGNEFSDAHAVLIDGSRTTDGAQRRMDTTEGGVATYDVWLHSAPAGDVTVGVSTTSDLITVEPAELTFNAENYGAPQIVSVTALEDIDGVDDDAVIDHTVTGYSGVSEVPSMNVSIHDNDLRGRFDIELWGRELGGDDLTFAEDDVGSINITPEVSTPNIIIVESSSSNPHVTVSPGRLRWDRNSVETLQFQVGSPRDADGLPERATITLSISESNRGTLYNNPDYSPNILTYDVFVNDLDAIEFDSGIENVRLDVEEGRTRSVTFHLAEPIIENVFLTIDIDEGLGVSFTPNQPIVFTPDNWNSARTVYFEAERDDDGVSEVGYVRFRLTGGLFNGEKIRYRVTVEDANKQSFVSDLEYDENFLWEMTLDEGEESSFTLRMNSAATPLGNVTLDITRMGGRGGRGVEFLSPGHIEWAETGTMTFTPTNWSVDQTMLIRAVNDAGTQDGHFSFVAEGTGGDYDMVGNRLNVTVIDGDEALIVPSTSSIEMIETYEDAETVYRLRLASEPIDDVSVTITSNSNYVVVDVDPETPGAQNVLTFNSATWNDPRTVHVVLHPDHDLDDATAVITHRASGTDYENVAARVIVNVDDQFECPPER